MAYQFLSSEWMTSYKEAINQNTAYRQAASDWTYGVVAMIVQADPSAGIHEDIGVWLDVKYGECRDCKRVSIAEADHASFIIVADYARWKQVARKELDPIQAMMQGKLKVIKGHLPTLIKYANASKELVESIAGIETQFKDELENGLLNIKADK